MPARKNCSVFPRQEHRYAVLHIRLLKRTRGDVTRRMELQYCCENWIFFFLSAACCLISLKGRVAPDRAFDTVVKTRGIILLVGFNRGIMVGGFLRDGGERGRARRRRCVPLFAPRDVGGIYTAEFSCSGWGAYI